MLPSRPTNAHKGTFGTVFILGGAAGSSHAPLLPRMLGAPALAALAALRAGCGLVKLLTPAPILDAALTLCPSATGFPLPTSPAGEIDPTAITPLVATLRPLIDPRSALVIGPGAGRGPGLARAIEALVPLFPFVVIDADALNTLADLPSILAEFLPRAGVDITAPYATPRRPNHCVLTPHPGEYRRLAVAINNLSGNDALPLDPRSADDRRLAAEALAKAAAATVVLKGAGSVIAHPSPFRPFRLAVSAPASSSAGSAAARVAAARAANTPSSLGSRQPAGLSATNTSGSPALATAGTGDVLAGLIAGLLVQHAQEIGPPDAVPALTALAVHAHGLAAERWTAAASADAGLTALDLVNSLPAVLQAFRMP